MSDNFERILTHADGHEVRIVVNNLTEAEHGKGDWQCDYWIEGLGNGKVRQSYGVDQIQAIFLALCYLSNTLYFSEDYKAGRLLWLGDSDLGLPVVKTLETEVEQLRNEVDALIKARDA